jgi:hypothetical protein
MRINFAPIRVLQHHICIMNHAHMNCKLGYKWDFFSCSWGTSRKNVLDRWICFVIGANFELQPRYHDITRLRTKLILIPLKFSHTLIWGSCSPFLSKISLRSNTTATTDKSGGRSVVQFKIVTFSSDQQFGYTRQAFLLFRGWTCQDGLQISMSWVHFGTGFPKMLASHLSFFFCDEYLYPYLHWTFLHSNYTNPDYPLLWVVSVTRPIFCF